MLTDAAGFPVMAQGFEGNGAETQTILQMIRSFMYAYGSKTSRVVADAGMISADNKKDIEQAGLSFILGM